ncbi:MAG: acyltransferase, partial [Ignavibacteriae bacterium]|nr:acyltransferase [Ignavibacteriota bacterium]
MNMTSFYTEEELKAIGFKSVGNNVLISRKTSLYGVSRISIANNVRIDDYCVLSAGKGGIEIGNYVHLAVYVSLQGDGKITLEDFVGLSSRTAVYSSNDDYFGTYLTNPTVPTEFTNVTSAPVTLHKHVLVGSGCVILPGVKLETGCAVGALSLVTEDCEGFYLYKGNPIKK